MKYSFSLILLIIFFSSCEKTVDFDIKNDENNVVVEGSIESDGYPIVRLSKSIGFFDTINLNNLSEAALHNADIYVSDDTRTIKLREYTVSFDSISLSVYSVDTANLADLTFKGVSGKSYDLKIEYGGKTYTSTTTIPQPNEGIDSIWSEEPTITDSSTTDSSRFIKAQYIDPPETGNYIRYFTKTSTLSQYLAPFYSVRNDDFLNGEAYPISIFKGANKMDVSNSQNNRSYFNLGDTVFIKWCSIDQGTFNFYRTLEYSFGASGNPFGTPVQITTNIKGGALGVWSGYGVKYYQHIITE